MQIIVAIILALLVYAMSSHGVPLPWQDPSPHVLDTNSTPSTNDIDLIWCQPSNTVARLYITDDLVSGFGTNYTEIDGPTNLFLPYDQCFFKVDVVTNCQ